MNLVSKWMYLSPSYSNVNRYITKTFIFDFRLCRIKKIRLLQLQILFWQPIILLFQFCLSECWVNQHCIRILPTEAVLKSSQNQYLSLDLQWIEYNTCWKEWDIDWCHNFIPYFFANEGKMKILEKMAKIVIIPHEMDPKSCRNVI